MDRGESNRGAGRKKECSKEESSGWKEEEYAPLWGARSRCVSMATRGGGGADAGGVSLTHWLCGG